MIKILILVVIAEIWLTAGQICFKKSADRKNFFSCPILWIGGACMLIGMSFWFAALASGDLNFVYMLGSIQFVIMLFAAHFFLEEKINIHKLIGTLFITIGIALTVMS